MVLSGFFDNGEAGEFRYFSVAHLIPLLLMGLVITLIVAFRKHIRLWKHEESLRLGIAFVMIFADMSYYWLLANPNIAANPAEHLPVRVCGLAGVFGSFLLVSKSRTLFDINYFWVFGGALNAILTPGVITNAGPTHFRYYQYWVEHTLLFITLAYMLAVKQMRPTWRSFVKSFIALFILSLIAIWVNSVIPGANYLYLKGAVAGNSILNLLPGNFWLRFMSMFVIGITLFTIVYSPWIVKDHFDRKKQVSVN